MNKSSYLVETIEALTSTLVEIDSAIEKIKQLQKDKPNMGKDSDEFGAADSRLHASDCA